MPPLRLTPAMKPARLLVIAGSDSSAGAGLQADLKTAEAFGVYAQTAVTAVTVQDTGGVRAIELMPPGIVRGQIEAALGDIGADVIKIGMLGSAAIAAAVADALRNIAMSLVLDPVLASSSGVRLLDDEGVAILKSRLLPRATLVTPNLPEAEALTGIRPKGDHSLRNCAQAFALMGARQVLFKGGHGDGSVVRDVLMLGDKQSIFEAPRQDTVHTHGTGCTLSTAIACGLALGLTLTDAVARAHGFVQDAIRAAPGLGAGQGPLGHPHKGQE
jgi:hydroxymethylpyrimidine/phosphomethylpyrimidine kinase